MSGRGLLDHAVVFVDDLDQAVIDYSSLGFRVTPGGTHAGGLTRNALIPFADGTYLELLAFNIPQASDKLARLDRAGLMPWAIRDGTALDRRFLPRGGSGEGLRDFAIAVSDIEDTIRRCNADGLPVDGPYPGSRVRTDGTDVKWQLAMPRDGELPFLIEDITEHSLRVPVGVAANHPNGIQGTKAIVVRVRDLPGSTQRYCTLLDTAPPEQNAQAEALTLQNGTIQLVDTDSDSGPATVCLAGSARSKPGPLKEALCHGAQIHVTIQTD